MIHGIRCLSRRLSEVPSGNIDVTLINVVLYMNVHTPAAPSYPQGLEPSKLQTSNQQGGNHAPEITARSIEARPSPWILGMYVGGLDPSLWMSVNIEASHLGIVSGQVKQRRTEKPEPMTEPAPKWCLPIKNGDLVACGNGVPTGRQRLNTSHDLKI